MARAFSVVITLSVACAAVAAGGSKHGVCIATGAKSGDWTKLVLEATSIDEAKSVAEAHQCAVIVDGKVAMVIHEPSFGITALKRQIETLEQLDRNKVAPYEAIDSGALSREAYGYLLAMHSDSPGFKESYETGAAKLFLSRSVSLSVSGGGKSIEIRLSPPEPDKGLEDLVSSTGDPKKKLRSLPADDEGVHELGLGMGTMTILFDSRPTGAAYKVHLAAKIMAEIEERLTKLRREYKELTKSYMSRFMSDYVESVWGGALVDGGSPGAFAGLPPKAQEELTDYVTQNYGALGFGSEDEALTFLHGSSVTNATFGLGVSFLKRNNGALIQTNTILGFR